MSRQDCLPSQACQFSQKLRSQDCYDYLLSQERPGGQVVDRSVQIDVKNGPFLELLLEKDRFPRVETGNLAGTSACGALKLQRCGNWAAISMSAE
jgi:hypothetical protein